MPRSGGAAGSSPWSPPSPARPTGEARLLGLAHDNPLLPAYVVQGEERSAALTALACDRIGLDAATLTVRELGIRAEGPCEHARPVALDRAALERALERHEVVVVPGFGALGSDGRAVLLGRGGSDLTALFLAAELGLDHVQLVKDVDGLYDRDPNADPDARRYDQASWAEAKALGGGLVQQDALDLAEARRLCVEVRNHADGHRTAIGVEDAPPRRVPPRRRLKVAVAGCGVVGGGALSRLLGDARVEVVGVLVRDPAKARDIPGFPAGALAPLLVDNADALLDRGPDILLEALSEAEAGHAVIRAALQRGVDVATANKQAVSRDPAGLLALAEAHESKLLWSASIGGGAPMVETLRAARADGPVAGFEAVLNGTVNFMLERLGGGASFDQALSADAAPPAGARQLCRCRLDNGRVVAEVRLVAGALDPLFAALNGERNALKVIGPDGSAVRCRGRGAGRWATAESLLADLAELAARRFALQDA